MSDVTGMFVVVAPMVAMVLWGNVIAVLAHMPSGYELVARRGGV